MEFPSSDACLEDLRHARDKNSNKVIRLDSYIHRLFSFIPTIADFDRLENTERNKLTLKTNQLVPAEMNVC